VTTVLSTEEAGCAEIRWLLMFCVSCGGDSILREPFTLVARVGASGELSTNNARTQSSGQM